MGSAMAGRGPSSQTADTRPRPAFQGQTTSVRYLGERKGDYRGWMSLHGSIVLSFVYYHHNEDHPRGMTRAFPSSYASCEVSSRGDGKSLKPIYPYNPMKTPWDEEAKQRARCG